ncbi:RagB/SusD family nutrient uptake outer membrane protein [Pedobacter nyackensis]|uniref:SusD family protein n=1 Tax=Pedobacter nyackensis TaxID=475255 RepID=A0A1W2DZD6_9SPHI|nr:RagB/SusD family nutrient uptake outer membrane protein [Pedobacter nyackensis]SMD02935.1 SusD family protein [Pedobacter nyackensis]
MNTKKSYVVILLLLLMASTILLPSCKKLLNFAPEDAPYEGSFWKTQDDALSALAGVYSLSRKSMFRGGNSRNMSHFSYGDLSTGEFNKVNSDFVLSFLVEGDRYYGTGINIGDFIGPYLEDLGEWDSYYKTINMANTVLQKVNGMPNSVFTENRKNRILGETYFLRAFNYFYMVRLWGDVPLVLKNNADPVSSSNLPRVSEKIVLDSALADLAKAQKFLKFTTGNDHSVSADKGAVFALKANILRWKYFLGKNTDNTLLTEAVASIDSITNAGTYALVPATNFSNLYKGRSSEAIFEIATSLVQNEFQLGDGFFYATSMQPYIKDRSQMPIVLNGDLLEGIYQYDNDARIAYNFDKTDVDNWILTKYTGPNSENVKFRNPENSTNPMVDCNIPIFRLGEQLLLKAECKELLGNFSGARTDLNAVRQRANVDDFNGSDAELRTEIFEETYREIAFEGQLWYVMIRNNQMPAYTEGRFPQNRFDLEGWKWPIARSILQKNQLLVQNKYWNGKL